MEKNKGFHVQELYRNLPFLFQRDQDLIEVAINEGIEFLSLSYVRSADDIKEVNAILEKRGSKNLEIFR